MLPADPVEVIKDAVMEGEIHQTLNDVEIEVAGIQGSKMNLSNIEQIASFESVAHLTRQMVSEAESSAFYAGAENASDEAAYHSSAGAAEIKTVEAVESNVLSNAAAALALEAGAGAAALEQIERVTTAQVEEEMRMSMVIKEEARVNAAGAAQDLEKDAAAASVDKDALSPMKLA